MEKSWLGPPGRLRNRDWASIRPVADPGDRAQLQTLPLVRFLRDITLPQGRKYMMKGSWDTCPYLNSKKEKYLPSFSAPSFFK